MEVSINMSDKVLKDSKSQPYVGNGKKKLPIFKIILGILLTAVITAGGYLLYKGYKVSSDVGLQLNPSDIFQQKQPELKKDSTNKYTSVMIIGVDTREKGNLMNTDTIILATYNYETSDITMVSIPRDFYVRIYPDKTTFGKINSVYAYNEQKKKDSGMDRLKDVIKEMTGIEIQYYGIIDFNGFVELIDAVGGIYVNVENSFTDYQYPKGLGYQTVSFKEGPQTMDGETALKFSRSRHSAHNNEGTDFAIA
jgi:LCP family protein required for cell wall assembly